MKNKAESDSASVFHHPDSITRVLFRPEFFYFSFIFFISLRLMPVQYWSSAMFFRFVFSIVARLIKLPPVTAPGEILPF